MENIEEGYQRNLEYKVMCETGYGYDECIYKKDQRFCIGDTIHTLGRNWTVDKVFQERIKQDITDEKLLNFYKFKHKENWCYEVHDDAGNRRLIVSREWQLTHITGFIAINPDNEVSHKFYQGQIGTELVEIKN